MPNDSPSGPPGSVKVVEFTRLGRPFSAMSAGPLDRFNHAISLMVFADRQEEIDAIGKSWARAVRMSRAAG
jgi:predicted 3-demethylubiquinone-9 3-methyltransferase (glyoxalase superfamily)